MGLGEERRVHGLQCRGNVGRVDDHRDLTFRRALGDESNVYAGRGKGPHKGRGGAGMLAHTFPDDRDNA